MKLFSVILATVLVLGSVGTASAVTRPVGNISAGSSAAVVTPLPMQFFCASNPSECRTSRTSTIAWSDDLATTLHHVNAGVNRAIRPLANPPGGWKVNPSSGDCNDYALTKRSELIRMGFPAGALRLAVTKTRRGEPHLILLVKTDAGDLVLDNLSAQVRTLRQSGYQIGSMSSTDPRRWVMG